MSATDELRRLLDERGVEWKRKRGRKHDGTEWYDQFGVYAEAVQEYSWDGFEHPEGKLLVRRGMGYLTPEQAIAATLGAGTCKQEEHGWSTEGDHARVWLTCGHDCMVETVADLPNFCPNCGKRVINE